MYFGDLKLGLVILALKMVVKLNTFRTNDKCFQCSKQPLFQYVWKAEPGNLGMQNISIMGVFIFSLLLCQQHLKMYFSVSVSLGRGLFFPSIHSFGLA